MQVTIHGHTNKDTLILGTARKVAALSPHVDLAVGEIVLFFTDPEKLKLLALEAIGAAKDLERLIAQEPPAPPAPEAAEI